MGFIHSPTSPAPDGTSNQRQLTFRFTSNSSHGGRTTGNEPLCDGRGYDYVRLLEKSGGRSAQWHAEPGSEEII